MQVSPSLPLLPHTQGTYMVFCSAGVSQAGRCGRSDIPELRDGPARHCHHQQDTAGQHGWPQGVCRHTQLGAMRMRRLHPAREPQGPVVVAQPVERRTLTKKSLHHGCWRGSRNRPQRIELSTQDLSIERGTGHRRKMIKSLPRLVQLSVLARTNHSAMIIGQHGGHNIRTK